MTLLVYNTVDLVTIFIQSIHRITMPVKIYRRYIILARQDQ